jgi:hypothetical protein
MRKGSGNPKSHIQPSLNALALGSPPFSCRSTCRVGFAPPLCCSTPWHWVVVSFEVSRAPVLRSRRSTGHGLGLPPCCSKRRLWACPAFVLLDTSALGLPWFHVVRHVGIGLALPLCRSTRCYWADSAFALFNMLALGWPSLRVVRVGWTCLWCLSSSSFPPWRHRPGKFVVNVPIYGWAMRSWSPLCWNGGVIGLVGSKVLISAGLSCLSYHRCEKG